MAAGAQVWGPITPTYRWRGEVRQDEEYLVLVKTVRGRLDDLVRLVRKVHSYEMPEVVAVPIDGGLADYLTWVTDETRERTSAEQRRTRRGARGRPEPARVPVLRLRGPVVPSPAGGPSWRWPTGRS